MIVYPGTSSLYFNQGVSNKWEEGWLLRRGLAIDQRQLVYTSLYTIFHRDWMLIVRGLQKWTEAWTLFGSIG